MGVKGQYVSFFEKIFEGYGERASLIKKTLGTELSETENNQNIMVMVRYLFEFKRYSFERDYRPEDLTSPNIPLNSAHLVIGLEPYETLKCLNYMSEQTLVILNADNKYLKKFSDNSTNSNITVASVIDKFDQITRRTISTNYRELSVSYFKNPNFVNYMILGTAVKEFKELLHKNLIISVFNEEVQSSQKEIEAFEIGYNLIPDLDSHD